MTAAGIKIAVGLFTKARLREVLVRHLGADDGDVDAIWADLAITEPPSVQAERFPCRSTVQACRDLFRQDSPPWAMLNEAMNSSEFFGL